MKHQRVAIIALGKRNAGKSNTWYEIFGKVIRTGVKRLHINNEEITVFVRNSSFEEAGDEIERYFEVFVINSSPEESGNDLEDYFDKDNLPDVVFCSVQYVEHGIETISWFKKHGYFLYIQWLNPGFYDKKEYADYLEFEKKFNSAGVFVRRSGKEKVKRAIEIKTFLASLNIN